MTVCIAVLAEKRRKAVLVADKMITAKIPTPFEFETEDVKKISKVAENVYILSAGDTLSANEIVQKSAKAIRQMKPVRVKYLTVEEVADIVRAQYQDYRRSMVVKKQLETRGLSLENYYNRHQDLNQAIIREIDDQLMQYDINAEFIVVGYDDDGICHLFTVNHPGVAMSNDPLGYSCVGSGAPHAMYYLIDSEYSKNWPVGDVKNLALEAKRVSEKAPGVGEKTVIKIIPAEQPHPSVNHHPGTI